MNFSTHSFEKWGTRFGRWKPPSTLTLAVLFGLAAMSLVAAVHWAVAGFLHARKEVSVPNLTGKTLEQALDILTPLKLALSKDSVQFDETLPPGSILSQAPPAGLTVREGKIVRVTLSSGGQVAFVPDVMSVTVTEAQNRLRASGLALGAVTQTYSALAPAGTVLAQTPAAGTTARPNAMVDLSVSKGPPPEGVVLMPALMNRPLGDARAWSDANKISPEIKEEPSAVFSPGTVMRQSPLPDTPITDKTPVGFVVAVSTTVVAAEIPVR